MTDLKIGTRVRFRTPGPKWNELLAGQTGTITKLPPTVGGDESYEVTTDEPIPNQDTGALLHNNRCYPEADMLELEIRGNSSHAGWNDD